MIRVVVVEDPAGGWVAFRQEQWMAEVRRDPGASARPRLHYDIPEDAYRALLPTWTPAGRVETVARLLDAGAIAVGLPSRRD